MAEAYPIELRKRVVHAYEAGEGTYPEIGDRYAVGEATVKRWVWMQRRNGSIAPLRKGGGTPSLVSIAEIEEIIGRLRDPTALEMTREFNLHRRGKHRIHVSSMKRALHRHGYVVKKNGDGRWRVCVRT
jgi:transposase